MKRDTTNEEQFITDSGGNRIGVILDLSRYQRLREAEEELADIRAYDAALPEVNASLAKDDFLTLREFETKHLISRSPS